MVDWTDRIAEKVSDWQKELDKLQAKYAQKQEPVRPTSTLTGMFPESPPRVNPYRASTSNQATTPLMDILKPYRAEPIPSSSATATAPYTPALGRRAERKYVPPLKQPTFGTKLPVGEVPYLYPENKDQSEANARAFREYRKQGGTLNLDQLRKQAALQTGKREGISEEDVLRKLTGFPTAAVAKEERLATFKKHPLGAQFLGGIGDVITTGGSVLEWLGRNKAEGLGIEDVGTDLQQTGQQVTSEIPAPEMGDITWKSAVDKEFWAKVPEFATRMTPFVLSLIPAMALGYISSAAGATALGLNAFWSAIVGSVGGTVVSRPLESLMEAGGTYSEAKARGLSEKDADKAATSVFLKNLTLAGMDVAELATAFLPTPAKVGGKGVRGLLTAGRVAGTAALEAFEEGYQEKINRESLGDEFKWMAPETKVAMFGGGIFGGTMGGVGAIVNIIKFETVKRIPPSMTQQFNDLVAQGKQQGMSDEDAGNYAINEFAKTPEGKIIIEQAVNWVKNTSKELIAGEEGGITLPGGEGVAPEEEIKRVTSTARATGAVGVKAITPRYVSETSKSGETILDYGSGKTPIHTTALQKQGLNVTSYDVGSNVVEGVHDVNALQRTYNTVFASNVLNVAPSESFLRKTLSEIKKATSSGGRALFNYPASPRKLNLSTDEMLGIVKEYFPEVTVVGGTKQTPLWEAAQQSTPAVAPEVVERSIGQASAADVIADIKAKGFTKQTGYGQFVIARGLKPEIDMKKFSEIFDQVTPKIFKSVEVTGKITPTHIVIETFEGAVPKRVQILEEGEGYTKWITEEGSVQSSPKQFIKSIEKITKQPTPEVAPEPTPTARETAVEPTQVPEARVTPTEAKVTPQQEVVPTPPTTPPPPVEPPVTGGVDDPPPSITPGRSVENAIGLRTIEPGLVRAETFRNYMRGMFSRAYTKVGGHELVLEDALANPALTERARLAPIIESLANDLGDRTQYAVNKAFILDKQGHIPSLADVIPEIGAPTIQDVAARLPLYQGKLTGEQVDVLTTIRDALKPYHDLMTEVGIDIRSRGDIMDGGFYIPRSSTTLEDTDMPYKVSGGRGGMKKGFEKPAIFNSQTEGISAGYKYPTIGQALIGYVKGAGQRATDAHIVNYFKALADDTGKLLGETPKIRMLRKSPEIAKVVDEIKGNLVKLKSNIGALTQRQMDVIDLWANDPDFADTSELIISLQEGLVTMKGGRPPRVLADLKALLKNNIDTLKALKPSYDKAMREAQVTPRDQGVITLPGLQGRTFPLAQANAVNIILKNEGALTGKGAQVGRMVQAFNGLWAMTHATGDLSASAIQGLLMVYDNPAAWSKAFGLQARAFFDKNVTGAFLTDADAVAKKAGRLTNAEWAKYGSHYFGASGFLEAINVSSKISDLPIIKQSNRAFSAFGDVARNIWRDNQLEIEMNKGRTLEHLEQSGDLERIAFGANAMTGWARKGAGGDIGEVLLFAPRWLQARLDVVGRAAAGLRPNAPIDQAMARNAFLKMIVFGTLITVAINAALKQDTDFRPIVDGKRNGRFMRIKVGSAYFSLFGSWDSLLGMVINIGTGKPLNVIRSMGSGLVATAFDLITNRDYNYNVVGTKPVNPILLAGWIARSSVPFAAGGMIESGSQMIHGEVIPGAINLGANILGIKSYVDKQQGDTTGKYSTSGQKGKKKGKATGKYSTSGQKGKGKSFSKTLSPSGAGRINPYKKN